VVTIRRIVSIRDQEFGNKHEVVLLQHTATCVFRETLVSVVFYSLVYVTFFRCNIFAAVIFSISKVK